ncbi:MAG TPA: ROK family protein [Ktedonobacterales bacterium]|nr:ROK family protein [Ktedonobacterales bacterium]
MSAADSLWPAPLPTVAVEIVEAGRRLYGLVGFGWGDSQIQETLRTPLAADDAHQVLADFSLRALRKSGQLGASEVQGRPARVALGVVLRGQVNRATGVVHSAQGLPEWTEIPLGERLSDLIEVPCVENATNAAAIAESVLGAASGFESVLYVSVGRQITSAYVVDGEVIRGAHDRAGEMGHFRVAATGPRCACGAEGHLNPIASAQAIVGATIGRAADSDASLDAILRVTNRRAEALTAAQVARLANEGDPVAASVIDAAVEGLSMALANSIAVLDPEIIVLQMQYGGKEALITRIHARVLELTGGFAGHVTIVASRLGLYANLVGARLLAVRRAREQTPSS